MLLQHNALDADLHLIGYGFPRDQNPSCYPEEDEMQELVERTRTVREKLIVSIAEVVKLEYPQSSAHWQKQQVKKSLVTLDSLREPKGGNFTEQEIDHCYEKEKQAACDLRFQQNIANALGAELVVRIDRSPHVSLPTRHAGSKEATE